MNTNYTLNTTMTEETKSTMKRQQYHLMKAQQNPTLIKKFGKRVTTFSTATILALTIAGTTSAAGNTHEIVGGDTLSSIAKKYNTTPQELKALNKLDTDKIFAGNTLKLPSKETATAKKEIAKTATTAKATTTTSIAGEYLVAANDCLSVIAAKFGVSLSALKEVNHLTSDAIKIGDKLKIPTGTAKTTTSTTTVAKPVQKTELAKKEVAKATSTEVKKEEVAKSPSKEVETVKTDVVKNEIATFKYVVNPGDTLYALSRKFDCEIEQIKELNGLKYNAIIIGQELSVPSPKTVTKTARFVGLFNNNEMVEIVTEEGDILDLHLENTEKESTKMFGRSFEVTYTVGKSGEMTIITIK